MVVALAHMLDRWVAAEHGRFALFLPVFMAAGVIAYFALPTEPPLALGPLCAGGFGLTALSAHRRPYWRAGALCGFAACLGFASAQCACWRAPPWDALPRTALVATGAVRDIEILPTGRRITLRKPTLDDGTTLHRDIRLRLRTADTVSLLPGDVVRVRALAQPPSPPDYPGGWDTQRDAYFSTIGAYGFAIGPASRVARAPAGQWRALREAIAANIMAALPGERGAIAAALLTGLGTAIPADDRAAFQSSGLAHLLAVAGLHIGIVMGLVFTALRLGIGATERTALWWPSKQIASVAALLAGAVYLALTGAHVPILRSFVMACLVTLAVLTGRRAISARALALAATGLMLMAPAEVMGVSFQMSFAAVLALVAGWEALRPHIAGFALARWWRRPLLYGGGLLATSALAGTASLPFAIYHFGNATLWYVPANMLAVPLTALWVMPCGLLALLLMPLGLQALALAPMGWGIGVLIDLARVVAAWPGAQRPVPQMPPQALLLIAAGLVWLCLWRSRLRLAALVPALAGVAMCLTSPSPDLLVTPDGRLIALRGSTTVLTETRPGASAFARASPLRIWGAAPTQALPESGTLAGASCSPHACLVPIRGQTAQLARDTQAVCAPADIVLSPLYLRGCTAHLIIDRRALDQDGATELFIDGAAVRLVTDRTIRGERPWVLRAAQTLAPGLPPAPTE